MLFENWKLKVENWKLKVENFINYPIHRFTNSPLHRFTSSPLDRFTSSPIHRFTSSPLHQLNKSSIVSWRCIFLLLKMFFQLAFVRKQLQIPILVNLITKVAFFALYIFLLIYWYTVSFDCKYKNLVPNLYFFTHIWTKIVVLSKN